MMGIVQYPDYAVTSDTNNFDFELFPEQCTAECTLYGTCNYDCLGQNGCNIDNYAPGDAEKVKAACEGADPGKIFDLNSTHKVQCCNAAPIPIGSVQTPFSLQTCSRELVPLTRLVEYSGKIYRLVVMMYEPCK